MFRAVRSTIIVVATSIKVGPWQSLLSLCESAGVLLSVLQPFFLALIVTATVHHYLSAIAVAGIAFVSSIALEKALCLIGINSRIGQLERVGHEFDRRIAELTARIPTLDHLESSEYLDQLQTLRDQEGTLGVALNRLLNGFTDIVRVLGTLALAATADWRLLFVVAAGLPSLALAKWFVRWQGDAEDRAAEPGRLTMHLIGLCSRPSSAAEQRIFRASWFLRSRLKEAATAWRKPFVAQVGRQGIAEAASGALFYGVAGAVLALILISVLSARDPLSSLVVAILLVNRLQSATAELEESITGIAGVVRTSSRYTWLVDYERSAQLKCAGTLPPPERLHQGIVLKNLTYRYRGSDRAALDVHTVELAAGKVVAIVGENGAGKSTLVKLLTGMYRPSSGQILVDGQDLADLDLSAWRARLSGAFQDYAEFELLARETVGVGDISHLADDERVREALSSGAAEDVVAALPSGLATQLGAGRPNGVGLSGGQWQRLALARGMMRKKLLLLVLDEPTAALDAFTESQLFERYSKAAKTGSEEGTVTLLVTHRFSTVAAADTILVLDGGRIVEEGTHEELLANNGQYAVLYKLQARGYA